MAKKSTQFNTIECEVRGPITWSDFCELKSPLEKDWGRLKKTAELVIFLQGKHDLRLKINNDGIILALKRRVKGTQAKSEVELQFELSQLKNVLEFIKKLGYKKGLFSFCERYDVQKDGKTLSIKFGSRIGDFFEIEEKIAKKEKVSLTIRKLKRIAQQYDLKVWTKETYEEVKKEAWEKIEAESLVSDKKLHPLINETANKISANDPQKSLNTSITDLKKVTCPICV